MAEAIVAGLVLAVALWWVARSMRTPNGFARYFSRGAYMRNLNREMESRPKAQGDIAPGG